MSSTPKGGVIASAALPGSPQIRTTNLRGGKRSPSSRRHRERSIAGVPANSHHKFAGWQAISSQMEIATGLRPSQRGRLLRPSGPRNDVRAGSDCSSGAPRLSIGVFVNQVYDIAQMLPRRLRKHAVTQVEDVPGPAGGLPQNLQGAPADDVAGCQQHRRIEVPLDATVVTDPGPRLGQGNPPVHADHL